ncbi:MAG: UDP-N-acetylglucosamine 2-epimerase, partial [Syntrophobacteraceae bacterium]|nr:UDP-N-acetylglucosamine 2-epimerase [Syntrophobacteraceae bacterium]
ENHGRPMRSICRALTEIVDRRADTAVVFPVHYSPQVRAEVFPALSHVERIWLCDPLDYSDTAQMLKRAALILTDSGGLQEEAPSLGKPVLVLRNKTERMEGILAGTARLVGTQTDRIVREACDLLSRPDLYEAMANATNPYGDGGAAKRIAEFMLYTFGRCSVKPSPFGSPVKAL